MPWTTCDAMKLKRDFVELALREGANVRELCRRFKITAPTAYKWLGRYREHGAEGLEERPRSPARSPGKTAAEMEARIVETRHRHPSWGGRKIRHWLLNRGTAAVPSASTITAILRRHHLLEVPAGPSGKGWERFERPSPNELWQMDFKGWIRTRGDGPCHPLTVLDDHSRFNILLEACRGENAGEVRPLLERAFSIHGLPAAILCDNGKPWGDSAGSFTKFEAWLLRLGVKVYHGRPPPSADPRQGGAFPPDVQGRGAIADHRVAGPPALRRKLPLVAGDLQPRASSRGLGRSGARQPLPDLATRAAAAAAGARRVVRSGGSGEEGRHERGLLAARRTVDDRRSIQWRGGRVARRRSRAAGCLLLLEEARGDRLHRPPRKGRRRLRNPD